VKACAPAAERNKSAILTALHAVLPKRAEILELAAGTGQHAAHMTAAMPGWRWQPTDSDPAALASLAAYQAEAGENFLLPLALDVTMEVWPVSRRYDAIYAANLIHIAPWAAARGVLAGAHRHLAPGGRLLLYGPFLINGQTAPSNRAFDQSLKRQDPRWGVRELNELIAAAPPTLSFDQALALPANNHLLVFHQFLSGV